MKKETKSILIGAILSGIFYALVMAGCDYYDGENFSIWKFIFNASFIGITMGFIVRNGQKKQAKKKNKIE